MPEDSRTHMNGMIAECDAILAGNYGEETQAHIDNFMTEMEGFGFYLRFGGQGILQSRSLDGIRRARGWLVANMFSLCGPEPAAPRISTSASATASAEANVSAEVKQTVEAVRDSEGLSEAEKDLLELAVNRMRNEADDGNEAGFADRAREALELASKGAGLVPRVAKAIGILSTLLGL